MTNLPANPGKTRLGLVVDLDICVGCHACAVHCKEWNDSGHSAPMTDWNSWSGEAQDADGEDEGAWGVWFNRVHTFEVGTGAESRTVYFPRSCLHCEEAACVTVCPTGASYKREADGIVLVNADTCIGCKLCSWACPYGAREYDQSDGVMKKCTLCIDRIYNENLAPEDRVPVCVSTCPVGARHYGDLGDPDSDVSRLVADRGGRDLMPESGYRPTNKYLPPRPRRDQGGEDGAPLSLVAMAAETRSGEKVTGGKAGGTKAGGTKAGGEKSSGTGSGDMMLRWIDTLLSR